MSDIVERTRQAMALTGHGRVGEILMLVPELVVEVERLHTWDGLMSLVDEHYPTDIFPHFAGAPDNPDRDPGPRILSLLREVDRLRKITDIIDPVPADEGDQPLGEKPAVTRDDLLAQGPW